MLQTYSPTLSVYPGQTQSAKALTAQIPILKGTQNKNKYLI